MKTAVAAAEPPPQNLVEFLRSELGYQHAAWCANTFCKGDCSVKVPLDGVQLAAYLPHGSHHPVINIVDQSGASIELGGPTAYQLAQQILRVAHEGSIPRPWLRPPA